MVNPFNAFVDPNLKITSKHEGKLTGYQFAVKDVFAIRGIQASAGNPDWLKTHPPAEQHATAIKKLLSAGAALQGTTITDELMYSLNGENVHYGTPVNPQAKGHIPGGSSSGSAVAVSAELVDFALGTDTGGSVRVPAAYCGVYGFRPTHGAVDINGVIPLSESFDTVGWMTRDSKLLLDVGLELLEQNQSETSSFSTFLFGTDAWELADLSSRSTLSHLINHLIKNAEESSWIQIAPEGLDQWATCFRALQGTEIWKTHGDWIQSIQPSFGQDIEERFKWASMLTEVDGEKARTLKEQIKYKLIELLGKDNVLIIPTTPGEAPLCGLSGSEIESRRSKTMQLSCIAGLAGLPQVTIPIKGDGPPVACSIIAGLNQDLKLLRWVYENEFMWKTES
ncbi:amidase [Halalkalibacter akibai]|uniref:Amidase domain-containing protein n=1 Tax=Halalkalibacter akibai (strain ATCC 43226 / DSM 21942 / CIP 109018 / JCM 9157 / 1139) TaxID=1236973 RepID=W4R0G5_HALA3|nr:amidase [Halalkalibacter akibai]GAE37044.1 hypothetical protein JCM9157_4287 [Halalkalibacter akibai JCM 9157]